MGKRAFRDHDTGHNFPPKRLRVVPEAPSWEEIHTSRQLTQLLASTQDMKVARHGLQSFKVLLDRIIGGENDGREERRQILLLYLNSSKPLQDGESSIYLPDIMETWSASSQLNNEPVMSAVAVVLDLLLQILSQSLDTVQLGLGVCRTLLHKRQQDVIARNLSADKWKPFLLSPTLRMLREALCFDGGALAKPIFRARNNTFKSLARNMGIRYLGEGQEDPDRPSVRTIAVRFFLDALKFLDAEAKRELLLEPDVVWVLTRFIQQDNPHLIIEILRSLRQYFLQDDNVSRDAKRKLLNAKTLSHISSLYGFTQPTNVSDVAIAASVEEAAHEFLMMACTVPSAGVLRQETGFYPKGLQQEDESLLEVNLKQVTLEQLGWMDRFQKEVPVRNEVLAGFIHGLRPWSSVKQSELLVAIFRVAPELVAHYFLAQPFPFEPKLSATWIGYAAFLYNTAILPLPEYFGWPSGFSHLPPPTSVVVNNIMPSPLTVKALSRCFTLQSDLVSFFATRILVVVLEKLERALELYQDPSHTNKTLWTEASHRLVDELCVRIPGMKELVNSFRAISEDNVLHREAASRLLRLYCGVVPHTDFAARFDFSPILEKAVQRLEVANEVDPRNHALGLMELENLLSIAMSSPSMRWFSLSDGRRMTLFTALLKIFIEAPKGVSLNKVLQATSLIAEEREIVISMPDHRGLIPLLDTLRWLKSTEPGVASGLWSYLDNCFSRCASSTVKYREMMLEERPQPNSSAKIQPPAGELSLLWLVMLEQLPFVVNSGDSETLKAIGKFLHAFHTFSVRGGGENGELLETVVSKVQTALPTHFLSDLESPSSNFTFAGAFQPLIAESGNFDDDKQAAGPSQGGIGLEQLAVMLHSPDSLAADNSVLVKWTKKSVDELVDEGYAKSLICLLGSEHTSIRKEALTNILKMAAKIRQSEYDEKEQVWLLLSELAETARVSIDKDPLPNPLITFAYHSIDTLKNPLHCLYPATNKFLTREPAWRLDSVPLVQEILQDQPEEDTTYYTQIAWLASYVLDCLRAPADVQLFQRNRAFGALFERVLAVAGVPYMRSRLRTQILRIVYRVTEIDGGSSTLTTRFGVVAWLEAQAAMCPEDGVAQVCRALVGRIAQTCDERVARWSKGSIAC